MAVATGAKRCAGQLRYAQFADWHAPVAFYLVEKVEAKVWVIARPLCHPTEEDAPAEHRVTIAGVDEEIVFERQDFGFLQRTDRTGIMENAVLFEHLKAIPPEPSPYTRANLLGACPAELRAGVTAFNLSPSGGAARQGTPAAAARSESDGDGSVSDPVAARLDRLISMHENSDDVNIKIDEAEVNVCF